MENLEWQGFRTHPNKTNLFNMRKIIFLIAIIVITIGSSCTNSGEEKRQEIQSEKHDSTHKEKKEADTMGMKMGGNELDSKKK